ncbi:MAG TPA: hypothetical protein VFA50_08480 [Stellaceae bacterium]|nr:hypothetical protein [Stellaceae bacterium]
MLNREKRASLSAGLLVQREARREADAPAAAGPGPAPLAQEVLSSKGAANTAGFRPDGWTYEGAPAALRGAPTGVVTPFPPIASRLEPEPPAAPPAPAAETLPAAPPPVLEAPAAAPAAPPRARRIPALNPVVLFGCLALAASGALFILSQAPQRSEMAPPRPVAASEPPAPQHPDAAPAAAPDETAALTLRGDQFLSRLDIATARLFYERAAERGSAAAALGLGRSFDPLFLDASHVRGIRGDPRIAAGWYRKASAAGEGEAAPALARLLAKYPE